MALRILSQRSALVDKMGLMLPDWFTMFVNLINAVNGLITTVGNRRITSSGEYVSITDTTDVTVLKTIPFNMGNTGVARLSLAFSGTNDDTNPKTVFVTVGVDVPPIEIDLDLDALNNWASVEIMVVGRAANSQFVYPIALRNCTSYSGSSQEADLSGDSTITISGQLSIDTDIIALESWVLEVEQS